MNTKQKLALAKIELENFKTSITDPYYYSKYTWQERRAHGNKTRSLKSKISRLESKVITEAGPIVHVDGLGQNIVPGARVVWSDSSRYAGFRNIFYVSYNNPKMVAITRDKGNISDKRNIHANVRPDVILVVDKILGP